ncbi:hypothetical protein LIER_34380 [Lithospermum erythrorhizon]|uniref:Reverse transcriptase domain-containing protein n=1 Tax=Lithospermum erythrorhizon TaxID=34254 RepID=A0AAV3S320_LITER
MDFTSLNKAFPKDNYPLPSLGRLVDGSAGHEIFDFLDTSRGYHQILLDEGDQEKATFIIEYGLYCWRVMSFGLKNARATYQRMVNTIFKDQIGKNMEIYVDDMLVKSKRRGDHLSNLEESLGRLKKCMLRINPENIRRVEVISGVPEVVDQTRRRRTAPIVSRYIGGSFFRGPRDFGEEAKSPSHQSDDGSTHEAGRVQSWAVGKSHHMGHQSPKAPRSGIQAQVLVDFIVEIELAQSLKLWTRTRNPKRAGEGILIQGVLGEQFEYALRFSFKATNNDADTSPRTENEHADHLSQLATTYYDKMPSHIRK